MNDAPLDTARFRALLEARRDELEQSSRMSADTRAAVALDQASVGRVSRIDAIQQQAMAVSAERNRQLELARIKAALARMADGEYGYCVICGDRIGDGRLNADPSTATCITCAK